MLLFLLIFASVVNCNCRTGINSLGVKYTALSNDEVPGKFVFRIDLFNKSPEPIIHKNGSLEWEIHFSHVYGIDDFMAALNGVELVDHYSKADLGLTLYRYGGFYWKFMTNEKWSPLRSNETFSFHLLGDNWMSSSSDIFNNWVLVCTEHPSPGVIRVLKSTIYSTTMRPFNNPQLLPSPMANVSDHLFKRNKLDVMESWDLNGGLDRFERYNRLSASNSTRIVQDENPRFEYRGLMIDYGRKFFRTVNNQPFTEVVLDLLGKLKMNKLHMHLSDSQGWRLEIPGLDALTEFGSNRCYGNFNGIPNGFPCLWPEPQDTIEDTMFDKDKFFTRTEFIELLKLAADKGIDVIVEFDFPAHARAALKSMEYHYYTTSNDTYRLADPNETFTPTGWARYYDDNINVCQESTYAFIEKVVSEVKKMYEEAGLFDPANPPVMHIGGNETPDFAWEESPKCVQFKKDHNLTTTNDLFTHHIKRHVKIVSDYGFRVAAWEEAFIVNHERVIDLSELGLQNSRYAPIVMPWNSRWDTDNIRWPYDFANADYQV